MVMDVNHSRSSATRIRNKEPYGIPTRCCLKKSRHSVEVRLQSFSAKYLFISLGGNLLVKAKQTLKYLKTSTLSSSLTHATRRR